MRPTLILDLDGTLVDSAPDLRMALNQVLATRGLAAFPLPEVTGMIGDGVAALVDRALAARGHPPDPAAVAAMREEYGRHYADLTRPYPGVEAGLRDLAEAEWRLVVCTNKPEAPARALLGALGLEAYFDAVAGGDGPRKPDPAHTLAALGNGDPRHAVVLGDHHNDIRAAVAAGIPAIFAAWGYGTPAMADGAAAMAHAFAEVAGLAGALLGH